MLTAEEATARLATLHDPAWREPAARRAAALPRPLREPAKALLSAGPSSTGPDGRRRRTGTGGSRRP